MSVDLQRVLEDNSRYLKNSYYKYKKIKRKTENENNLNFQEELLKAEHRYQALVVKSKISSSELKEIEKTVEEKLKDEYLFAEYYKNNILNQIGFDTNEVKNYKDHYKNEVFELIKDDSSKEAVEGTVFESAENEEEIKAFEKEFEEKYSSEEIYTLKKEVIQEIREMELTHLQHKKLDQIEQILDEDYIKHVKNKENAHERLEQSIFTEQEIKKGKKGIKKKNNSFYMDM